MVSYSFGARSEDRANRCGGSYDPPYMRAAIAKADADGAALIVFTLRTPGGLLDSTRDINNAIIAAKTPVAVFVGPSGNRAASAGFLITMQRSNLFQSAVMSEDLKFLTGRTIYSRIGDVVGWLSVAFTLAALLATRRRVK